MDLDPITLEVIQNALASTADEMALVIMRSAYSPVVRDTMDYSTALCDRHGHVIAQGLTLAVQLGTFPTIMRHVVDKHASDARPGDVYIANDPYGAGGQHLPDIYIIEPLFVGGVLEAYAATMAHHSDVGGIAAGSSAVHATEIYQEGLRLPLLKLVAENEPNDTLFAVIARNTRQPTEVLGDLRAQIAACKIGAQGLTRIVERYGATRVRAYLDELQRISERLMRAALTAIPDGVYSFRDYIDGYGEHPTPLPIDARVHVSGGELTIDLTAPAQVPAALNCPVGLVFAACYCAIRQVIETDLPNCEGYMRPITINAPEGTIVNPILPAACGARGVVGYRVYDAVMGALAQAVPDRVPAPSEGGPTLVAFGGWHGGRQFVLTEVMVGNWGARADRDGHEGISNPLANLSNQPVELIEADVPLQILRYGLVPDSGGPGRHRGGLAFARDYRVLGDSARMSIRSDRRDHPPHGLEGAGAGSPSTFVMNPGTTAERLLPAMPMEAIELRQGDVIHHASAGGGGMGDPFTRDPASVLTDVLDGKVSLEAARDRYGVLVAGGAVDVDLTLAAREGLRPPPSRVAGSRDAKPLCSHIEELETPVVTIDLDAVERNIERMQVYCDSHGLGLRAHVKTHKLPRIAAIQIDRGALSIVCQKLDEAEVMADAAVDRILLTYPLVGEAKWARAARLASRVRLSVIGDSLFIARGLASFLPPNGSVGFLVECDTGFARAGVQTPAEALELARAVTAIPEFRFDGLLTHPVPDAAQSWFAAAARLFADASIDLPTISVGGTPHARHVHERVPLATELRAGVYAYGDRACMLRGDHSLVDCAMRVRATVVSRPTANRVILDAGSKTLSSDLVKDTDDGLFGLVVEYPDLRLVALSEEHAHGELGRESPAPVLGEVVSIVPNHACAVSNLHDHIYLHCDAELPERVQVAARGGVR